jgi:hypothetical protein
MGTQTHYQDERRGGQRDVTSRAPRGCWRQRQPKLDGHTTQRYRAPPSKCPSLSNCFFHNNLFEIPCPQSEGASNIGWCIWVCHGAMSRCDEAEPNWGPRDPSPICRIAPMCLAKTFGFVGHLGFGSLPPLPLVPLVLDTSQASRMVTKSSLRLAYISLHLALGFSSAQNVTWRAKTFPLLGPQNEKRISHRCCPFGRARTHGWVQANVLELPSCPCPFTSICTCGRSFCATYARSRYSAAGTFRRRFRLRLVTSQQDDPIDMFSVLNYFKQRSWPKSSRFTFLISVMRHLSQTCHASPRGETSIWLVAIAYRALVLVNKYSSEEQINSF